MRREHTRREFLQVLTSAAGVRARGQTNHPSRPNVLIILTDDQGYGDLSCHGNPVLRTPNLDRMHKQSVRFTDFHSAPMCTPTRGQLMSGMDAARNGATAVSSGRCLLRRDIPTLADIFAASEYRTGMFGKWHLGDNYPYRPMERGFHEAKYHRSFGMSSAAEFENDYFNGRYFHNGLAERFEGYCTDFWFQAAMTWMRERQRKGEPFFCYLPTNAAHTPAWVAGEFARPYEKEKLPAAYYGMIANLDMNIGRMENFLTSTGLRDDTLVVFATDNGGTAGARVYNAGMRGMKRQLYEGGHRVPCFVRWPAGGLRPPGDIDTPAQVQDILPTMAELCGLQTPGGARFDGHSLAGLLRNSERRLPNRMLVVQYGVNLEKWNACVIWDKWRLVNGTELYDIGTDRGQTIDISAQHAEVIRKMREHYESWWAGVAPAAGDFRPIGIGSPHENPTALVSCDWEGVAGDNLMQVLGAAGGPRGGSWNLVVERAGDYEIALFRWPPALKLPLSAACPPQKRAAGSLREGKSLPIASARLTIAGQAFAKKTGPPDTAAVFRVSLEAGTRTHLHGWFQNEAGADLCGAFYAQVKRL